MHNFLQCPLVVVLLLNRCSDAWLKLSSVETYIHRHTSYYAYIMMYAKCYVASLSFFQRNGGETAQHPHVSLTRWCIHAHSRSKWEMWNSRCVQVLANLEPLFTHSMVAQRASSVVVIISSSSSLRHPCRCLYLHNFVNIYMYFTAWITFTKLS